MPINRRKLLKGAASTTLAASLSSAGLVLPSSSYGKSTQKSSRYRLESISDAVVIPASDERARALSMAYATQYQKALPLLAPELRVMVKTTKAAQEVVRWAAKSGTPFALRSGGHCFMGFSLNEHLVIDVREMNQIIVDEYQQTITIGAGAKLLDVANALAEYGLILAHGTYGSVGMAGHTLGGGFGHRTRQDGLLCDQLNWVEMVTSSGDLVRASEQENADLFWALRGGGGGQFGLVTKMQFRVKKAGSAHEIEAYIPMSALRASEAILVWQFIMAEAPRDLSLHALITKRGNGALFQLTGRASDMGTGSVAGGKSFVQKAVKDILRQTGALDESIINTGAEVDINRSKLGVGKLPESQLLTHSHLFSEPTKPDLIGALMESIQSNPPGAALPNFECWGGAMSDLSVGATAFPHRDAQFVVHVQSGITKEENRSAFTKANDEMRPIFQAAATGGTYANYPDTSLSNWAESYWGTNLTRLKLIKAEWDPNNLFGHAHSIARA